MFQKKNQKNIKENIEKNNKNSDNTDFNMKKTEKDFSTSNEITWCPGCPNFATLSVMKKVLTKLSNEGYKKENFTMATGIGCMQKIFDYLNISGIYGLHGRVLPLCLGIKIGNPNLNVIGFAGDGDAYAEGIEHLIHTARYNLDITYIIANNQNFALTTGQGTPTSEYGFKSKVEPMGQRDYPINPMMISLASGATFIARCNPLDINHTAEIIERAIKHKGFAIVEMLQDCLIFHNDPERKKRMYKVDNGNDFNTAIKIAREFDYNSKETNIPIGIFYQTEKNCFEESWPQLKKLLEKGVSWKELKK
ncbi:MAG: thiamine pyrophosphate-dependent enzyme [Candidatus Pacearchaeota archaeon]